MRLPLLKVRDLCAGYRGVRVVDGVSFSLSAGERVSVIGPNACGKTTLFKAICKLIPLMGGEVKICGTSITKIDRRKLATMMSMMAQISEQWFDFSVMDTVLMGRYSRRRGPLASSGGSDRHIAEQSLRTVGLLEQADDSITWLSGGQRQRVMLARAFAQEPQIIALDEPTNHLDLKHQVELFEHLQQWASSGERAVIQVMHDLNLARMYSDRILLMSGGKIAADDSPDEVLNLQVVDDAYNFGIRRFMSASLKLWEN